MPAAQIPGIEDPDRQTPDGCSMLAMIRSLPAHRPQRSISTPNTRFRRPAQFIAT
jgi:hypothetical protein